MKRLDAANLQRALQMIDVKASTSFQEARAMCEQLIDFESSFLGVARCFSDGAYRDIYFGILFIFDPSLYKPAQTFVERCTELERKYESPRLWKDNESSLNKMLRKFRKTASLA